MTDDLTHYMQAVSRLRAAIIAHREAIRTAGDFKHEADHKLWAALDNEDRPLPPPARFKIEVDGGGVMQPLTTIVLPLDEANAALSNCEAAVEGGYDGDGSRAAAIAANGEGGWVRLREVVEELRTCDPLDIFKPQVGHYYADHIEREFTKGSSSALDTTTDSV